MKNQIFSITAIVLISTMALFALINSLGEVDKTVHLAAMAAPMNSDPLVSEVDPISGPNDLDTSIEITGTSFTDGLSAYLGDTELENVTWINDTTVNANVPWGMDPGVYTLTVVNPDGEAGSLVEAFTVIQGIGVLQTDGPYGGPIYGLKIGDSEGHIVYATVTDVGLFRSRDGGASWELIFIGIGHINDLAVDPQTPEHLYIFKQFSETAITLYRSTDGGDNWYAMPEPIPGIGSERFLAFVSPHDSKLYGGLFDWVLNPSCESGCGLFRFDEINQTWERLGKSGLLDENTGVTAVGFHPHNANIIYAGLVGGRVVLSTDGGQTWSHHSDTPIDYIKELVVNPVGGDLWVCGPGGYLDGGLYKYTGGQWISMYDGKSTPSEITSIKKMIFDPVANDIDTQHIWIAAGENGALKSEDGGQSWVPVNSDRSETIALNPLHPLKIFSGNNEGVVITIDGGVEWQPINEGLAGIVPDYLGISPHDPALVYAVSSGGILRSLYGGNVWEQLTPPSYGPILVDPVNPQRVVNAAYDVLLVAEDGTHFSKQVLIPMPPDMSGDDYLVVSTAMIARSGLWVLGVGYNSWLVPYWNFDGGGGIYLSEDGENWSLVTNPLLNCPPNSLSFDPVDTKIIYGITSGYTGGELCEVKFVKSSDGGQTWFEHETSLPIGYDGFIAVEPTPPYRVFLAGAGSIYMSSDQGTTWTEVNGIHNTGVTAFMFVEGSPSVLYAGTHNGLFRTMDGGQTWHRASGALGQLKIWSLAGMTVDDRQVLYVSLVAGAVESGGSQTLGLTSGPEQLVNAGVYRFTTLSPVPRAYLPLIER